MNRDPNDPEYQTIDPFDRTAWELAGFAHTREVGIKITDGLATTTYFVQTFRVPELGDTVLIQRIDRNPSVRIALPPRVTDAIARQRDTLGAQIRRAHGKAQAPRLRQLARERQAAGIPPAFLKGKRRKAGKK